MNILILLNFLVNGFLGGVQYQSEVRSSHGRQRVIHAIVLVVALAIGLEAVILFLIFYALRFISLWIDDVFQIRFTIGMRNGKFDKMDPEVLAVLNARAKHIRGLSKISIVQKRYLSGVELINKKNNYTENLATVK